MNDELPKFYDVKCPYCGYVDCAPEVEHKLRITSLSKAGDSSLNIKGEVKLEYCAQGHCFNCGNVFDIVRKEIPILYPSMVCPKCDSNEHLKVEVNAGEYTEPAFVFAAILYCEKCGKGIVKKIKRVIKNFLWIRKLKIGPTGIEIEVEKGKDPA